MTVQTNKTLTFIEKAKKIHGDKYDYSKVEYVNNHTKVCIICPIHGEFWQRPMCHLSGRGCKLCGGKIKSNINDFIEKAKVVHGNKYDYSQSVYKNCHAKMKIICPIHGEFWQDANHHLQGCGCPKCGGREKLTTEQFIIRAKKIHGDKYDYSKVEYINNRTKVCIVCPIHGEFWQTPTKHLTGRGCYQCGIDSLERKNSSTTEEFIEKAIQVHGNKYDYSKVEYKHNAEKVCIICPIHGEFWQTPNNHLHGDRCPKCNVSKLEGAFIEFCEKNNITYEYQKRFKWLSKQSLDFYLPNFNIAVECQGMQHFAPIDFFGGEIALTETIQRDTKKFTKCVDKGIKVIYVVEDKNKINNNIIYKYNNVYEISELETIIF